MIKKGKVLIVLVILVSLSLFLGKAGTFNIHQIDIEVNNVGCVTGDQIRADSKLIGGNILMVNSDNVIKNLLDKYPCVKSVRLERKFPKTVKLMVDGRVALAQVVTFKSNLPLDPDNLEATPSSESALLDWSSPSFASQQFLADENGVIFAVAQSENLPRFYIPEQTVKVGQRLDAGIFVKASTIFTEVGKLGIAVSEVKLLDQDFLILQPQKIALSLKKDILKQLVSLQLILQEATIDGRKMETIDLRFDKPVVRFVPKK